ncbi:MAG TPA: DUF423 domain-containing protein [Casimicrobiaceae bacterium]|nr:DUF423 domain-containing protein [Casimicrobiaceae bacterium]
MTARLAVSGGAALMAIAVAFGAFGAHALKGRVTPEALAVWQTGVEYHAWHALGLVATGVLMLHMPHARALRHVVLLFASGILLFSGSLYGLALGAPRALGMVTPVGGVAFIAGWILLSVAAARGLTGVPKAGS